MSNSSRTILVIDDDLDTIQLLRITLQKAGFRVLTATTFSDVEDRLVMAEKDRQKIDLIVLDIMMPNQSGFDLILSLKVMIHPMPPVIFLSAKCTIEDMVKASELGAAKYLVKPTSPEKLVETVNSVLQQAKKRV